MTTLNNEITAYLTTAAANKAKTTKFPTLTAIKRSLIACLGRDLESGGYLDDMHNGRPADIHASVKETKNGIRLTFEASTVDKATKKVTTEKKTFDIALTITPVE